MNVSHLWNRCQKIWKLASGTKTWVSMPHWSLFLVSKASLALIVLESRTQEVFLLDDFSVHKCNVIIQCHGRHWFKRSVVKTFSFYWLCSVSRFGNVVEQESPPVWTQEAYRPRRIKYSICCSVPGVGGIPCGGGPPWLDFAGVPSPLGVDWQQSENITSRLVPRTRSVIIKAMPCDGRLDSIKVTLNQLLKLLNTTSCMNREVCSWGKGRILTQRQNGR